MQVGVRVDSVLSRAAKQEYIPPEYTTRRVRVCRTAIKITEGEKGGTPFMEYLSEVFKTYQLCMEYGSGAVFLGGVFEIGPLASWRGRLSPLSPPALLITFDPVQWDTGTEHEPGHPDYKPPPPPPPRLSNSCGGGGNIRMVGGPPSSHWFWVHSRKEGEEEQYRQCTTRVEQELKDGTGVYKETPSNNWEATTVDAVGGEDFLRFRNWSVSFTPHEGTQTKFGVFPNREGATAAELAGRNLDYFIWAEVRGAEVSFRAKYKNPPSSTPSPPKAFSFKKGDRITLSRAVNELGRVYFSAAINGREVWRTRRVVDET